MQRHYRSILTCHVVVMVVVCHRHHGKLVVLPCVLPLCNGDDKADDAAV